MNNQGVEERFLSLIKEGLSKDEAIRKIIEDIKDDKKAIDIINQLLPIANKLD